MKETSTRMRCAIYTRKSTEDGLEQDFNSLDAQREAAEAYIFSQKSEGWEALPAHFDDGGYTGGNTDRPALQSLLEEIREGRVDCVVVYKVDRLSRSLLDFARLMDLFEKHNVTFVSVTQQFSTSNSMGRLTLNILLSFAQFEREIIAERTRDKMAAARKRGKWMGGMPILGYDVAPGGGKLIVNEIEAEQVRTIFRLYIMTENMGSVFRMLRDKGWRTKAWTSGTGRQHGGKQLGSSALYKIISNSAYIGKVECGGELFDGEHEAIVSQEEWDAAQGILKKHRNIPRRRTMSNRHGELLRNLLWCTHCNAPMEQRTNVKQNKIYRYYVCQGARKNGWHTCPAKSVNAAEIEDAVVRQIRILGENTSFEKEVWHSLKKESADYLRHVLSEEKMERMRVAELTSRTSDALAAGDMEAWEAAKEETRKAEEQLVRVLQEKRRLQEGLPEQGTVARAVRGFDAIWDYLVPDEKANVLHKIINRIGYDADAGTISIDYK